MKKHGRPSKFTKELSDIILERIANGESARAICRDKNMPAMSTLFRWLAEKEDFQEQYAHAREVQAETLVGEILDIADDGTNDFVEKKVKGEGLVILCDQENIQRSRLRVDARKWVASKLAPKKYGDKVELEHSGKINHGLSEEVVGILDELGFAKSGSGSGQGEVAQNGAGQADNPSG